MKTLTAWRWWNKAIPMAEKAKAKSQVKVFKVMLLNPQPIDFSQYCRNDTVLITGDGHTLPADVQRFKEFGIPYDLYCVNRSMVFFEEPIRHWGAVDVEESVWFSQNLNEKIIPEDAKICRHTIGIMPNSFDAYWQSDKFKELEGYAKHLWTGNSAYLAMLSSIEMGYKRIVLAGVPLDNGCHWYEPEGTPGPMWVGRVYMQWMDFKMIIPEAENIRSMSGYSGFILGQPSREWLNGHIE